MKARLALAAAGPFLALAGAWLLTAVRVITPAALWDPSQIYWRGWADQGYYSRSAAAFAQANLAVGEHWYPILYPLLGVPFARWWPSQPFFAPDIACYLLAFAGFARVAAVFGVGRWPAALIFAATTLVQFVFAKLWIEPWTTTLSAALLWLALGMAASLWTDHRIAGRRAQAVILALACALVPFARPSDTPVALIALALGAVALWRSRDGRTALLAAGVGAIAALALAALYVSIYGFAASPYIAYSQSIGFDFAWIGWKAYVILVDPRAWFGEGQGLIERAPWLIAGAAGLLCEGVHASGERRPVVIALVAAAGVYLALIIAYVGLLPTGLWRYNNVHYFKWLLPLFGLFGIRFAAAVLKRPARLGYALPFALLLLVRPEPVPVAAGTPARLLIFSAPTGIEWTDLYLTNALILDRSGTRHNFFDYQQVPGGGRVRAVALHGAFAGDERWLGTERVAAQLRGEQNDGFAPLYLTGPWPRRPLRRYGIAVTLGLPGWRFGPVPEGRR